MVSVSTSNNIPLANFEQDYLPSVEDSPAMNGSATGRTDRTRSVNMELLPPRATATPGRNRLRKPAPTTAAAIRDAETGTPVAGNRLRDLAGANAQESAIQIAHAAGLVLYPKTFDKMPDDVLVSLLERSPVFEQHGITTEKDFKGFLRKSLAESIAPTLGSLGYLPALPLAAFRTDSTLPVKGSRIDSMSTPSRESMLSSPNKAVTHSCQG